MNIYVLNVLNIEEHTEETLKKGLEIHNSTYNKQWNIEQYINYLNDINKLGSKYIVTGEYENAYFYNLTDAIYAAEHNMADVNEAGCYNCITIRCLPIGQMYAFCYPTELYVYKFKSKNDGYELVDKNDELFKYFASQYMYIEKQKVEINLDLTKKEEIATKDFVSEFKESFDKKDYGKMKDMLNAKERQLSNQINGFLNDIEESFSQVDESINKFFDIFNGKI